MLTDEQARVVSAIEKLIRGERTGSIGVMAGAGSGKTFVLLESARRVREIQPHGKVLYLAYNRDIAAEAKQKFGSLADSMTAHSFAFRTLQVGKLGRKLRNLYPNDVRSVLAESYSDTELKGIIQILSNWCHSGDPAPKRSHVPRAVRSQVADERLEGLIGAAEEVFEALAPGAETRAPLPHDIYVKYWQLIGAPGLEEYDLVLFDEAQDANPVLLAAMDAAGNAVYVGDSHQAIYGWRGAVDAMSKVRGQRLALTRSFRFGPKVAALANAILAHKKKHPEHPLRGHDQTQTEIGRVDRGEHHARIYRTNRLLIREAMMLRDRKIPFAIAGNLSDMADLVENCAAIADGKAHKVRHPMLRAYQDWSQLEQAAERGSDGREVTQAVRIVEEFSGRLPDILAILRNEHPSDNPRITLTTAHRSKGLEWDRVVLASDFDHVLGQANPGTPTYDAEINLMYVAVTRARALLEVQVEWIQDHALDEVA